MIPAKQPTHSKLLIHVGAVIITIITTLCTHTYSHCSLDMQRKCGFLMLFITDIVFLGSWGGKILNISLRFLLVFAVGCVLSWRDIAYADNHRTSHLLPDLCSVTGLRHLWVLSSGKTGIFGFPAHHIQALGSQEPCLRLIYPWPLPNLNRSITVTPTWSQMLSISKDSGSFRGGGGHNFTSRRHWQHLETFLMVTTGEILRPLVSRG